MWINLVKAHEGLVPYHTRNDCMGRAGTVRIPTLLSWVQEQQDVFKVCERCYRRDHEVPYKKLPHGSAERTRARRRQWEQRRRERA